MNEQELQELQEAVKPLCRNDETANKLVKLINEYGNQRELEGRIDEHEKLRFEMATYAHEHVDEMRVPEEMETLHHDAAKKMAKLLTIARKKRVEKLTQELQSQQVKEIK